MSQVWGHLRSGSEEAAPSLSPAWRLDHWPEGRKDTPRPRLALLLLCPPVALTSWAFRARAELLGVNAERAFPFSLYLTHFLCCSRWGPMFVWGCSQAKHRKCFSEVSVPQFLPL